MLVLVVLTATGERHADDLFRSPLGIPISLSGNFAEMRANHFHTGLDIRTNGQTGYRVYAAADGWVARVVVSPTGYGNALYVDHPGGYQTVYGHLDRFTDPVADYVRSAQYARRVFPVDLAPDARRFPVRQGEVIAWSGNSGSSGGPHLHFEIRDAATAHPLNPLLHGIPVADATPPRIYSIRVYPLDRDSRVEIVAQNGRSIGSAAFGGSARADAVRSTSGRYALASGAVVRAAGRIGFGIRTHDFHDTSSSRLGAYRIRLDADGRDVYSHRMDRLDFALGRYLNAHVDYGEHERSGEWIQRSWLLPGNNRLAIYETDGRGILRVEPGVRVALAYSVEDAHGNTATLPFEVEGTAPATGSEPPLGTEAVMWDAPADIVRQGITVHIPAGALYEDLDLRYDVGPTRPDAFSPTHVVHDRFTPLQNAVSLSIDAPDLPAELRPYALIARVTERGGLASEGGSYAGRRVNATTRTLGAYVIAVDTTAPSIRPVNITDGASLAGVSSIRVRIGDDLAGIASYEGRVDGDWVLFAYDAKTGTLEHVFDGRVARGRHRLDLRVADAVGNARTWSASFTR